MGTEIKKKLGLDQRFPWSFLGVVIALLSVGFALYTYYHQPEPDIVYEIDSQSDVFDLHRPLQDLTLSFRGQDVQQQNLNLRILSVRIWNRGMIDILQGAYDQQEPWGITVTPGQVIEVRVGQNNSQYLASHINPHIVESSTIQLNKVILERDKFVTLDILVLHHKDAPPHIAAYGKIAGINQIPVIDASAPTKPGFIQQLFSGSLFIHIGRFIFYFLVLIAVVTSAVGVSSVFEAIGRRGRRKRFARVLASTTGNVEAMKMLEQGYIEGGLPSLQFLSRALSDDKKLARHLPVKEPVDEIRVEGEELIEIRARNAGIHVLPSETMIKRML